MPTLKNRVGIFVSKLTILMNLITIEKMGKSGVIL
jgi:hypothetical protein